MRENRTLEGAMQRDAKAEGGKSNNQTVQHTALHQHQPHHVVCTLVQHRFNLSNPRKRKILAVEITVPLFIL